MTAMKRLDDTEIRSAFKALSQGNQIGHMFDEFDLARGMARVDLIQFDDFITGYEIKSDKDNLDRLVSQIEYYNRTLEKIVLITGSRHRSKVLEHIPAWWGVVEARKTKSSVTFRNIREAKINPFFNPASLLDLLWKNELLDLLKNYGFRSGFISKTKFELKQLLQSIVPYKELKTHVINYLFDRMRSALAH